MKAHLPLFLVLVLLVPALADAQPTAPSDTLSVSATGTFATIDEGPAWSCAFSAYAYFIPDDYDYLQPTLLVDRGRLHLEARYNYEDQETVSTWIGVNLAFGDAVAVEVTPMVGGVFGNTDGIAPGLRGSVEWWKLEWYAEGEYLFDLGVSSDSYWYAWSEFTLSPGDWYRLGLVGQRTRAYETDLDIQRGFLLAMSIGRFDLAAYFLNPDEIHPITVVAGTIRY